MKLKIDYEINTQGRVMHVIKPLEFTATLNLFVPENGTVNCEVVSATCESTQLECGLVETTVRVLMQLQSIGNDSIVMPFVASCPVALCPPNTVEIVVTDSGKNSDQDEEEDDD